MKTEELETLLLGLLKGTHSSLTISFNDDNGPNYETVGECVEDRGTGINWVSAEERQKAIETNRMWRIQWYPDTPVGSYSVHASSLPALVQYVENFKP